MVATLAEIATSNNFLGAAAMFSNDINVASKHYVLQSLMKSYEDGYFIHKSVCPALFSIQPSSSLYTG